MDLWHIDGKISDTLPLDLKEDKSTIILVSGQGLFSYEGKILGNGHCTQQKSLIENGYDDSPGMFKKKKN